MISRFAFPTFCRKTKAYDLVVWGPGGAVKQPTTYGFETLRVDFDLLEASFTARNGISVRCRLIQPDDAPFLIALFTHLSPESRRRRFNLPLTNIDQSSIVLAARHLSNVDNRTVGGAILALVQEQDGEEAIGVARLARFPSAPASPEAEAALVVRDDFHGQGVGTALMTLLALLARRMNVERLTASVQADNEPLFALLRHLHLPLERHTTHGETTISIQVDGLPVPKSRG